MVAVSQGMLLILGVVQEHQPCTYEDLEPLIPMCERIANSHLKRLMTRGWLMYDRGIYTMTPEGEEILRDA